MEMKGGLNFVTSKLGKDNQISQRLACSAAY